MLFGVQWYYWLILVVAIIVAIFAWIKALGSSRERREKMKREAEIWRRDYELREKYSVLTEEKLRQCPDSELLHAVAMNIQVQLENAIDINNAFEKLPVEKKYVYTLEYFDEDAKERLSLFFKNNGKPLVPNISGALRAVEADNLLEYVNTLYPMYDPDSEVSVNYELIDKTDERFREIYNSDELCRLTASYIRKNKEIFI